MWRTLPLLLLAGGAEAQGTTKAYPPGWNGEARTPPMGWRSWNAFGNRITQDMMTAAIDALTAKNWSVDGKTVSLSDVGYKSIGVDEGWEGCGKGVNGSQHDAQGFPVVNAKFPDLKKLVDYGHSKGLHMGWYLNGCACGEKNELKLNYQGDIKNLHDMGWDATKIDGCGAQVNMTYYAELMKASGKSYAIENCHWGRCGAFKGDEDGSSCPTTEWCPFNWYRTSGDINSGAMSWFNNLQTTKKFQDKDQPLSVPGCWAYPDMLEVGRVQGSVEWNRAHFGAWCVVSAPLILGLDLTQHDKLAAIIPIVTNSEALAVNQQWAGHPGRLVAEITPSSKPAQYVAAAPCSGAATQGGWSYDAASGAVKAAGGCLDATQHGELEIKACGGGDAQKFTYDASKKALKATNGQCVDANDWTKGNVWLYNCNGGTNQQIEFNANGTVCDACHESRRRCFDVTPTDPSGGASGGKLQVWVKPQPGGAVAVLVVNPTTAAAPVSVPLSVLGLSASSAAARDIWARADKGTVSGKLDVEVPSQDSVFLLLK